MSAKHTPGPWRIPSVCDYEIASGMTLAATVEQSCHATANARLIAAAPELLEACKLALLVHDTLSAQESVREFAASQGFFPFFDPGQACVVRAAIAKATGGAQ